MKIRLLLSLIAIAGLSAAVWGGLRVVELASMDKGPEIPSTQVKRGRVTIVVYARGELQ
jgi:hypothetical protein